MCGTWVTNANLHLQYHLQRDGTAPVPDADTAGVTPIGRSRRRGTTGS